MRDPLADAAREAVRPLAEILAKLMRINVKISPTSALVSAWCRENPRNVDLVVGILAGVLAKEINQS